MKNIVQVILSFVLTSLSVGAFANNEVRADITISTSSTVSTVTHSVMGVDEVKRRLSFTPGSDTLIVKSSGTVPGEECKSFVSVDRKGRVSFVGIGSEIKDLNISIGSSGVKSPSISHKKEVAQITVFVPWGIRVCITGISGDMSVISH
ncbi:MAG: hypothetical protein R3B53_04320 [Candidatus Paceibacterota bacterium]